ncbi:MAG: Na/Pi symporter [Lachnospiraceae bacterium]|nr:Na/Pi symporter [Lachnospiraceae bacterium]
MDIFGVVTFLGGLALFFYGMCLMEECLVKFAGGKLERMLERLTASPFQGVLVGTVMTALIQSSSAVTVMVVGLVDSGMMSL